MRSATHDCVSEALRNDVISGGGARALNAVPKIVDSDERLYQNLKAIGKILNEVVGKKVRCSVNREMRLQQKMRN